MVQFNKKVELIKICLAVAMCIFGCCMLVAGFIVAPLGVIDQSVLIGFGEILTFSGAILGINYLYSSKHRELEEHIKSRLAENGEVK